VKAEGQWSVVPPSHRYDMAIYQDLIEEVARIHGYDNIQINKNASKVFCILKSIKLLP
jgi:phenylalanyl-tRNA synthetase beta chain